MIKLIELIDNIDWDFVPKNLWARFHMVATTLTDTHSQTDVCSLYIRKRDSISKNFYPGERFTKLLPNSGFLMKRVVLNSWINRLLHWPCKFNLITMWASYRTIRHVERHRFKICLNPIIFISSISANSYPVYELSIQATRYKRITTK